MPRAKKILTAADLLTEREFTVSVCHRALAFGWKVSHNSDVRKDSNFTTPGAPDLLMVRKGRVVFAELKRQQNSNLSDAQAQWLSDLWAAGQEAYVWQPADLSEIDRILA